MDNIENIDIDFDSSFLLALEAQKRNYEIFYYNPEQLFYDEGIVKAAGYYIKLIDNNKKLADMGYHKDEIHLEELVEPELENLILESGDNPQEIYTCVYEWREKLRNYAEVAKDTKY